MCQAAVLRVVEAAEREGVLEAGLQAAIAAWDGRQLEFADARPGEVAAVDAAGLAALQAFAAEQACPSLT